MGYSKMSKLLSAYFFTFLIGSTLCVIPEGEYQFGPLFGAQGNAAANRFFGNKYFEAFFDKSQGIKPLLAKKVLLGVGAVGAGALAVGAAGLWKKHQEKGFGHSNGGWGNNNYYSQGQTGYYPSTDYQYQYGQAEAYPSYQDQSAYNYQDQASNGYADQTSGYEYGNGGYSGYSR